jgi:hypothetical protein
MPVDGVEVGVERPRREGLQTPGASEDVSHDAPPHLALERRHGLDRRARERHPRRGPEGAGKLPLERLRIGVDPEARRDPRVLGAHPVTHADQRARHVEEHDRRHSFPLVRAAVTGRAVAGARH